MNYHMISPMSKGLFDRAISQSGTIMNVWLVDEALRFKDFRLNRKNFAGQMFHGLD